MDAPIMDVDTYTDLRWSNESIPDLVNVRLGKKTG